MLRHPKGVLVGFAVVVLVLAILGFQVQDKLTPTSLDISNTPASDANEMLRQNFGDTALFAILLQGPADEIDKQGPELVRALRADNPQVTTLSPWDRGSVDQLRPSPDKALVIADFHTADRDRGQGERRRTRRNPRTADQAAGQSDPVGLPDPLEGPPGRVDLRQRAGRADRPPDPPDRPPARLPIADRGGDPAHLRGDHGLHLQRRPDDRHPLGRCRRLRADRLHDDGPCLRRGLCAVDGLALPRGAGRRGRPEGGGDPDPAYRRADDRLRRQHPDRGDAGRPLHRPRRSARLARRDGDPGRDPQCLGRDDRRPGGARPARPQRQPLADRPPPELPGREQGPDGDRRRRPQTPGPRLPGGRHRRARARGPDDRAEDRAAQRPAALPQQPGPQGRRTDQPDDRARLRRPVRGRRRSRKGADHDAGTTRRAAPVAGQGRENPRRPGRDRARAGLEIGGAAARSGQRAAGRERRPGRQPRTARPQPEAGRERRRPAAGRDLRSDPGRGAAGRGLGHDPGGGAAAGERPRDGDRRQRRSGRRARPVRGGGEEAPEGRRRDHEGRRRSAGRGRIHRQDDGGPQHQHPQQRAAPLAEAAEETDEDGARRTRRPEAAGDRHQHPAAGRAPAAADDDGRQDRPELQRRPRRRSSGVGLRPHRSSPASTSSRSA